ncbi:MAG: hypothetical protein ACI9BN_001389 [Francisella sp.]|jgi:hypothetical protein
MEFNENSFELTIILAIGIIKYLIYADISDFANANPVLTKLFILKLKGSNLIIIFFLLIFCIVIKAIIATKEKLKIYIKAKRYKLDLYSTPPTQSKPIYIKKMARIEQSTHSI